MDKTNFDKFGKKPHPRDRENIVEAGQDGELYHLSMGHSTRSERPVFVHEKNVVEDKELIDRHRYIRFEMQKFLKDIQTTQVENKRSKTDNKILRKLFAQRPGVIK